MPYKEGNDPDSGYLVPDEFEKQLIQKLHEANILRQPLSLFDQVPEDIHTAVLYCLAYLYEYWETADFDAMVKFLRAILTPYRKEAF